jgi:HSP20 family protein
MNRHKRIGMTRADVNPAFTERDEPRLYDAAGPLSYPREGTESMESFDTLKPGFSWLLYERKTMKPTGRGKNKTEVRTMAFELKPYKPFGELASLRDEMDKMWNRFFGEWPSTEGFRGEWAPSLDVSETEESIVVRAEVAGLDPKDIDISLTNDALTIKGKREQEKEEKEENYHRIERSYGSFSRSIRLPKEVKGDKIKASCKNGVLKITLPKSKEAKEIKIKVE